MATPSSQIPVARLSSRLTLSLALSLGLCLAVGVVSTSCGGTTEAAERPRRLVLLTLDTLRLDAFRGDTMPATSAFFEEGQRFTSYRTSSSSTQPTHASLFTGLHPWEHGVVRNGLILSEEHVTIAEELQELGFHTSAVTSSFPVTSHMGFAQGFDQYDDRFDTTYGGESTEPGADGAFYSLSRTSIDRALDALDALPDGDQFLWVHLFDPHDPYGDTNDDPEKPAYMLGYLQMAGLSGHPKFAQGLVDTVDRYEDDLRFMDRQLARLLERLDRESDDYETLVVLTSDHGESFAEDGSLGHGDRINDHQINVPLAIRGAGWTPGERDDVAGSIDVTETLLVWAGAPAGITPGRDLAASSSGGTACGMRRLPEGEATEIRLDGTSHDQSELRFFTVQDGQLLCGSSERLLLANAPEDPVQGDTTKVRTLFRRFESDLQAVRERAAALEGEGVNEALSALGYGNGR